MAMGGDGGGILKHGALPMPQDSREVQMTVKHKSPMLASVTTAQPSWLEDSFTNARCPVHVLTATLLSSLGNTQSPDQ